MPSAIQFRKSWSLFLISFSILFWELAFIRWLPAYVTFLAYFTNFVLMAAFLGSSVGCLAVRGRREFIGDVPSLLAIGCALALGTFASVTLSIANVRVGNPSQWEQVYFGAEISSDNSSRLVVPMELLIAVFYVIVALIFVGLGQVLGRKLTAIEDRIAAYTVNIVGSLAGIVAFSLMSWLSLPPVVWFGVGVACLLAFLREAGHLSLPNITLLVGCLGVLGVTGTWTSAGHEFTWSPYYNIHYRPPTREIWVNSRGHQVMTPRDQSPIYSLPYELARAAGAKPPADVLIIGAGSGNDVAAALAQPVQHVDAVEIDPHIAELGRRHHPDQPYSDPRVRLTVTDGRGFLRRTDRKYDLIVYALVDSMSLHSSFATVRLESFLFTQEAIAEVRDHLKPGGTFVAYNYYREGWVVARLAAMAEAAFGAEPLVLSPTEGTIRDTDHAPDLAVVVAGATEPIRDWLEKRHGRFDWVRDNSSGTAPALYLVKVASSQPTRLPRDDWPFLYLRSPRVPTHNLAGIALVLVLSAGLLAAVVPSPMRGVRSYPHLFWLGAGFMLIETKSVTQMAVLFGSTWVVNSVVFAAVLAMILLANLFVSAVRPRRLWIVAAGLVLALAAAFAVPLDRLLGLGRAAQLTLACVITFAPIFFAGVLFAIYFRAVPDADVAMGANIAGVVLGGVLEYLSLVVGYQWMLALAGLLYLLALMSARRSLVTNRSC